MADKYNPGRSSPSPRLPALLLLIHLLCSLRAAHGDDVPTEAALSTRWTCTSAMPNTTNFRDRSQVRPVLLRPLGYIGYDYAYACGFYCRGACDSFLFAVVVVKAFSKSRFPQVVWAANRDRPVRENATLQLGSDGDLVLTDADGTKVWSSGTSGKPVAGLNLTESGNLVLFGGDKNKSIWWESTALLPGQKLRVGQSLNTVNFSDGSQVWPVLLRPLMYPGEITGAYACGFYCRRACDSFLFAVVVVPPVSTTSFQRFPQLVWVANRDRPVRENATLQLGSDGDLVLTDADGTKVWSSETSGKPVAGLNLTESGNLVLFGGDNKNNKSVWWESFAHPTDSLLPGQKLRVRQSLTANDSPTNFTEGLYYLFVESPAWLDAFFKSDPPTNYAFYESRATDSKNVGYFEFVNWSVYNFTSPGNSDYIWPFQFLRLESDGHLRQYRWISESFDWSVVSDLLTSTASTSCFYPTVCGRYGICSGDGQCSCPQWYGDGGDDDDGSHNYFVPVDRHDPNSGCKPVIPFSCGNPSTTQKLLLLENVSYSLNLNSVATDEHGCRTLCENKCSCRAAFYDAYGYCHLTSEVFSLRKGNPYYNPNVAFIKVQNPPSPSHSQKTRVVILVSALGSLFLLLLCLCSCRILVFKKKIIPKEKDMDAEEEEVDLEQVSGAPRRFSLEELRVATGDFCKKLGQGGFGSVYEGRIDEKSIAVKRLDGAGQGRKEFLAEVQTLGKIHHVNLVKLVGYCAEKSCRLLVYEFMPNGSLDRWIFSRAQQAVNLLDWQTRCKILLGVAKGIYYLHEECSQKIVHLDIKPQNILLDDRFEAKVSDFGLAKLIDRDQTHVVTRMRGTPGYLAPEWLSSEITEKVDVYSFGVVVLETVCGRRNLDRSQPEEDALLLNLLKRKAENGELLDLVDESIKNAGFHNEEAMKMFKIAMWCLQDKNKRPSMSTVVKALESGLDVETIFLTSSMVEWNVAVNVCNSAPLSPSLLSAPR